ncbi:MAG: Cof-type HAD-IIB family hydrolase [Vampirovibrionales bacterium]|nr:Cof-type HAD-IIB family hydrolase [Vampirovibrionales bacterium]
MKQDIKLIAFDLDGTLLNERLMFSPRVRQAIKRVQHETDVRLMLATGRMFASALPFVQALGFTLPLVGYQGGMTRALTPGYPICQHTPLELARAHALIEQLCALKLNVNVYVNDVLYTNACPNVSSWYANAARVRPVVLQDAEALIKATTSPPTKLVVITEDDDPQGEAHLAAARERLMLMEGITFCSSRRGFLEIMHADASKWAAVRRVAEDCGIAPEAVMAVGDHENDLSMITQAGVGVAMGNAPEHVRAQAPYVTASITDDGAADAIERFVLTSV